MAIDAVLTIAAPSQTLPVITTDRTRDWVVLNNATWYRLWLKIGTVGGPPATPDPTTRAQWDGEVGAGDTWKVPVPAGWDGTIYVGVFAPAGALAPGLTQYATVASFATGQDPDVSSSAPVTLLPQQRVVTVPVVPHSNSNGVALGVTGPATHATLLILNPTYLSYSGQAVTIYVYWADLLMTGLRDALFYFEVSTFDGSSTLIAAYPLFGLFLGGHQPKPFYPAQPVAIQVPATPTATTLRFTCSDGLRIPTAGVGLYKLTPEWDIDPTGQPPPPSIGNGAATAPGTVY